MTATVEKTEFRLPSRLQGLQPTLIRQFFERALPDSINFGLGEPDLPTPQFLRDEAARVARDEQNGYTSHPGMPALRLKIAEQYPHLKLAMTDVVVTCGSQEAMTAAFLAIVDKGDDVLLPNPSFPAYDACVKISEGNPVYYRLPADKEFAFDIDEFRSAITPRTKAAVVISPEFYDEALLLYKNPLFRFAELLIFFAVLYHAVNGLRIVVQDFWPIVMERQRQLTIIGATIVGHNAGETIATVALAMKHKIGLDKLQEAILLQARVKKLKLLYLAPEKLLANGMALLHTLEAFGISLIASLLLLEPAAVGGFAVPATRPRRAPFRRGPQFRAAVSVRRDRRKTAARRTPERR